VPTTYIFEHGKIHRAIHTLNTELLYIRYVRGYFVGVFKGAHGEHITHVSKNGDKFYCTCNYHLITGKPCKHIVSLIFELQRRGLLKKAKISIK